MSAVLTEARTGAVLIEDALFGRLAARVMVDHGFARDFAERIVDQALVFLAGCAEHQDASLAPSRMVDIGWHTFLLHTREYREFCHKYAGRFLDHVPDEESGEDDHLAALTPPATAELLRCQGFRIDADLWHGDLKKCHQCHAGCYDSPRER